MKIRAYKLIKSYPDGEKIYEIHIDTIDSMANYHLVRNKKTHKIYPV